MLRLPHGPVLRGRRLREQQLASRRTGDQERSHA
jgi:hypothetical protein